jgi:hypothetical protein
MARFSLRKRKPGRRGGRHRHQLFRQLRFEPLEARHLLATFTVTNLNDSGADSLRDAVAQANVDAVADDIVFDSGLIGTIGLTSGELLITQPVTITGPGAPLLTIDAQQTSRIFNIDDSSTAEIDVEITDLTLTGGNVSGDGGAITSLENLTVRDSRITGNTVTGKGGGLNAGAFGGGTTTIESTTIEGNSADLGGGLFITTSGGRRPRSPAALSLATPR